METLCAPSSEPILKSMLVHRRGGGDRGGDRLFGSRDLESSNGALGFLLFERW